MGAGFSALQINQNDFMQILTRVCPIVSFSFCLLGGIILLLNGLDREDFVWSSFGLFLIGMAFFIGPMLWVSTKK